MGFVLKIETLSLLSFFLKTSEILMSIELVEWKKLLTFLSHDLIWKVLLLSLKLNIRKQSINMLINEKFNTDLEISS